MIGISFYLNDEKAEHRITEAAEMGVTQAFTSLHIPEESGALAERAKHLLSTAKEAGIEVYADVSYYTPQHLGISSFKELKQLGVAGLRLDDFFDHRFVLELAKDYKLAINASTVTEKELCALLEAGISSDSLLAWHNFYPKKETGLDENFFQRQNELFQAYNIRLCAFVPGMGKKRGPLHIGLPTLEKHRDMHGLASTIELLNSGIPDVYIGDPDFGEGLLEELLGYEMRSTVALQMDSDSFPPGLYRPRPDFSRDVLRLMDTRTADPLEPANTNERPKGSITIDNKLYGRYNGEVSITLTDLPADPRVNVIGKIKERDIPLLSLIKPENRILLK